jgi:hypothetical protein
MDNLEHITETVALSIRSCNKQKFSELMRTNVPCLHDMPSMDGGLYKRVGVGYVYLIVLFFYLAHHSMTWQDKN